jgi:hypothetical protein
MRTLVALVFGALLVSTAVEARGTVTINDLLDGCAKESANFDRGFCLGYMKAILEFRSAYDNAYRTRQTYCIPPKTSHDKLQDVFVGWARKNRKVGGMPALWGFTRSLNDQYPC